jgi:2-keto-4-pentenoate hydratase/2-oxohepta-3-ene-1,7-dioic acid hydratase in catechol pathway
MDAARAALEREETANHVVKQARILPPLFPTSLLTPDAYGAERRIVGPEQDVPWPEGAAWIDYEPKVAAILGLETSQASREEVRGNIFGYTLVNDWSAHGANGDPLSTSDGLPLAIGPCVVTVDELDPQTMVVQVMIDGEELAKGSLNGAAESLYTLIGEASRLAILERGDAFALGPFGGADLDPSRRLWPGARIELSAEGIGTLRNRLSTR